MAIVGLVQPEPVDESEIKEELKNESKEATAASELLLTLLDDEGERDDTPKKLEHFSGKEWLTEGHFQRAKNTDTNFKRRRALLGKLKSLQAVALETPITLSRDKDQIIMLQVYHPSMRGKTKTVGSVIFIFNAEGVAKVPTAALNEYNSLLRQPGYRVWPLPIEKEVKPTETVKEKVAKEVKKRAAKKAEKEELVEEKEELVEEKEEPIKKPTKKSGRKLKKKSK